MSKKETGCIAIPEVADYFFSLEILTRKEKHINHLEKLKSRDRYGSQGILHIQLVITPVKIERNEHFNKEIK